MATVPRVPAAERAASIGEDNTPTEVTDPVVDTPEALRVSTSARLPGVAVADAADNVGATVSVTDLTEPDAATPVRAACCPPQVLLLQVPSLHAVATPTT